MGLKQSEDEREQKRWRREYMTKYFGYDVLLRHIF